MKLFLLGIYTAVFFSPSAWHHDLDEAKKIATEKHQLILLNFSGSDWCAPCIRLRKEILESDEFKQFADSSLVLLNADFPRLKKNQLTKEQTKKNEALADKYNPKGKFPFTLILNSEGKVLKSYGGYPDLSTTEFINQIKALNNAGN